MARHPRGMVRNHSDLTESAPRQALDVSDWVPIDEHVLSGVSGILCVRLPLWKWSRYATQTQDTTTRTAVNP